MVTIFNRILNIMGKYLHTFGTGDGAISDIVIVKL